VSAWKDLERRVCRALGGERAGPMGAAVSDCIGTPFAVECKRSLNGVPRRAWVQQAKDQGEREGKPWLLVIAGHNDRRPIAVMDFWAFAQLAEEAGRLGVG
jgi:hypothetical protein